MSVCDGLVLDDNVCICLFVVALVCFPSDFFFKLIISCGWQRDLSDASATVLRLLDILRALQVVHVSIYLFTATLFVLITVCS